jgi:hypothetical protein
MGEQTSIRSGRRKRSRRELLAGAAGAAGVVAAQSVIGAKPAYATDGDVVLGLDNQPTAGTTGVSSSAITGLHGKTTSAGINDTGVFGEGPVGVHGTGSDVGVKGDATNYGVKGSGFYGVYGAGTNVGVLGSGPAAGVEGTSDSGDGVIGSSSATGSSAGVHGLNDGGGKAVFGEARSGGTAVYGISDAGTGVLAQSAIGTALQVSGKATFSRSGIATVAAGSKAKTVKNVALTSSSFIIATVQDETDVSVKAVVRDLINSSFKILLNKNATFNTPVGWLVFN